MGLSVHSMGIRAVDSGLSIQKRTSEEKVVAIAGNPNVGKSTVFNALTGMRQHTGNWPGKTVTNAQGRCRTADYSYILVDIPGTYSLMAHSAEEEVARNFICFGGADAVVVVCDATCLERNLNLVLQTLEITPRVVLCVNLMDEAAKKGIRVDLEALGRLLGIPVAGTNARRKRSLSGLLEAMDRGMASPSVHPAPVVYEEAVENAIRVLEPAVASLCGPDLSARWLSLRLLDDDPSLLRELKLYLGRNLAESAAVQAALAQARSLLNAAGLKQDALRDSIVSSITRRAADISHSTVCGSQSGAFRRDRRLDRILTSRWAGYPIMVALLALVFWITISGANYPSELLSSLLFAAGEKIDSILTLAGVSVWLRSLLVDGIYRVLSWVVSVMLPPMAIFFPLFTLLEDVGYLPRIAYNMDYCFKKCSACGKQALTMCMGFGCNAAGVIGCRIIDSPRERLIAILTNSFVPCNGRFPPPHKEKQKQVTIVLCHPFHLAHRLAHRTSDFP